MTATVRWTQVTLACAALALFVPVTAHATGGGDVGSGGGGGESQGTGGSGTGGGHDGSGTHSHDGSGTHSHDGSGTGTPDTEGATTDASEDDSGCSVGGRDASPAMAALGLLLLGLRRRR